MKMNRVFQSAGLCAGIFCLSLSIASAADIFKADVPDTLNLGSSWVGGTAPGASDTAVWDHTVVNNLTSVPGAPLDWAGLRILDPAGAITITNDGNTLTLGASGIDLSHATNDLTVECALALSADQTWRVTNGLTLSVSGTVSGTAGLTLTGGGPIQLGSANTYSGATLINGGVGEPANASSFSTGAVTNNGGELLLDVLPNSTTMKNTFTVNGTTLVDLANRNVNLSLAGAWAGNGTVIVSNMTGGTSANFTMGGNGNGGGNMTDYTGSVVILATNAVGTETSGILRFNNSSANNNQGSSSMSIVLGGAAQLKTRNSGATVNVGALSGDPDSTLVNGAFVIGGASLDTTYSGSILSASLTKVGAGTFTLTGTNTYTGLTTVSSGTLQIGDGVTAGAGTLGSGSVVNNATLIFNRPDDVDVTNDLSGSGTTVKTNANTLTYGGADTASGTFLVSQGTLALSSAGNIAGPIALASATTFDVTQNPYFTLGSALSGFGTVQGALTASAGAIDPGAANAAGTLTFASGLIEQGSVTHRFEISAPGSTNDLIAITGDLDLNGVNPVIVKPFPHGTIATGLYPLITYTGSLVGNLDNLQLSVSGAFGTLTNPPGQIAIIVTPPPRGPTNLVWVGDGIGNAWDYNDSTDWVNGSTLFTFLNGDSVTFNNAGAANPTVNLTDTLLPASVMLNASSDYTFTGEGEISGATGLLKTNSGTLTILNTNSYTGPTLINGGTLAVSDLELGTLPSSLGASSSDPTNLVFNGGTLSYLGAGAATDRGATLNGAGGDVVVPNGGANLTLNGTWVGLGALMVSGPGTLTIGSANTYSGGLVISNTLLVLGNNTANSSGLGASSSPVTFAGGTLQLHGYSGSTGSHYNTPNNPLVIPAGATGTLQMFARGPSDSTGLASPLSGSGTLNLVVNYVRDNLDGDWSGFNGLINVESKTFLATTNGSDEFRINNSFGYANATIYLNGGVLMDRASGSSSVVDIGGLGGAAGAVIGPGNKSSGSPTWVVGWNNTSNTFAGTIEDDGVSSVVKVGTGKWILTGSLTTNIVQNGLFFTTNIGFTSVALYTGFTTVSNGVLALDVPSQLTNSTPVTLASPTAVLDATDMGYVSNQAQLDGSTNQFLVTNSLFEVVSGQTMQGIGTLRGKLLADSGSTFNVGLPTGSLTVTSNVELAGTITMNVNAVGSPNSSELLAQNFTIDPTASLTVANVGPEAGATFQLFNHPVNFTSISLPTLTGTNSWINNLNVNGSITMIAPPAVPPTPTITHIGVSGTTLTITATNGAVSGRYVLMESTNLATPLANWIPVLTNTFDGSGNLSLSTNVVNRTIPQEFYLLSQ